MNNQQSFRDALSRLHHRFPSAFGTTLPSYDWGNTNSTNDLGLLQLFQDYVAGCKSDELNDCYAKTLNSLYEQEFGLNAGVGMVNGSIELRCHALIQALDEFGGKQRQN